jgi:uncharacterized protein (DUF58 family)
MLTRHGWGVVALAVGLLSAGRILGVFELFVLGGACAALVLVAALYVGLVRLSLRVSRQVRPFRIHAGDPARVDLHLANLGRRTPVLRIRDAVTGTAGADLTVGPLRREESSTAAYRIPTERRGVLGVGPLTVEVTDPFRLATVRIRAAERAEMTVFPRVRAIQPPPFTVGRDPHGAADNPNSLGRVGDDFYALRYYTVGDDLRRVHWPSTARVGELMVRQHELPWQGRSTVLLDTRLAETIEADFETAVSVAASLVEACARRHDLLRVVTTDGGDSGFAAGHAHADAVMEYLATAQRTGHGTLHGALGNVRRSTEGGALVVVGGAMHQSDVDAALRLRSAYGAVYVLRCGPNVLAGGATRISGPDGNVLAVPELDGFGEDWNRITHRGPVRAAAHR